MIAERAVDGEVAATELVDGTDMGHDVAVRGAECGAFAVDGLRAGDENFFDRQVVVADELEHLRGAEAVDEDVLRHLRHIAAVGRLVEDDVDVLECGEHRCRVLHIALHEFGGGINPAWAAELVGIGLEVVEDADTPAFADEEVGDVRPDEARASGDKRALLVSSHDGYANGLVVSAEGGSRQRILGGT